MKISQEDGPRLRVFVGGRAVLEARESGKPAEHVASRRAGEDRQATGGGGIRIFGKGSKINFQIPPSQQYNVRQASAASLASSMPSSSSRPPPPPYGNSLKIQKINCRNIFAGASPQISPSSTVVHRRVIRSARRIVQSVVYTPTIPEHRHEQRLVRGKMKSILERDRKLKNEDFLKDRKLKQNLRKSWQISENCPNFYVPM